MYLKKVCVKNFRLLHDAALLLEKQTTVIVGRNNSGKTSLTEVMSRFLDEGNSTFKLEDFSCVSHGCFWEAYLQKMQGAPAKDVRLLLPSIDIILSFEYTANEDLGTLTDFVVDLDLNCTEACVVIKYQIDAGKIDDLFADMTSVVDEFKAEFFKIIRKRISSLFATTIFAVDPNDETNQRSVAKSVLRAACANNCISAQRGLDDDSQKERVVIGKVLEKLFATAKANETDTNSHMLAEQLEQAVKEIQDKIGIDFNTKLNNLLPALSLFGYPGLTDPKLLTETIFDVERLLTNHTKVRYTGSNGVHLPESYNGLGARNIILILLQLLEHFKAYCALGPRPAVHLVFIEEPEVHLHPQMQEVFIRKLGEIATEFSSQISTPWPVQFVVSTHSSHIANEAHFETIRYFLALPHNGSEEFTTIIKDLHQGLSGKREPDRTFLHQYLTLTRCDLFFADKAILIEGTTEKLLLPRIIEMLDAVLPEGQKLGSQYISIVEVGGAYSHLFFDFLEFLELKTLVITDIDTVKRDVGKNKDIACPVHLGERSSNACINTWFADPNNAPARLTPPQLIQVTDVQKIVKKKRLAYQIPETDGGPCGRSFEDAYMLANTNLFPLVGTTLEEREIEAWENARGCKKSSFALDQLLINTNWNIPRYIHESLLWLATDEIPIAAEDVAAVQVAEVKNA